MSLNGTTKNGLMVEVERVVKSRLEVSLSETERFIIDVLSESLANRIDAEILEINKKLECRESRMREAIQEEVAKAMADFKKEADNKPMESDSSNETCKIYTQNDLDNLQEKLEDLREMVESIKDDFSKFYDKEFPITKGLVYACDANVDIFAKDLFELQNAMEDLMESIGKPSIKDASLHRSQFSSSLSSESYWKVSDSNADVRTREGAVAPLDLAFCRSHRILIELRTNFERERKNLLSRFAELKAELDVLKASVNGVNMDSENLQGQMKDVIKQLSRQTPQFVHHEGFLVSMVENVAFRNLNIFFPSGACYFEIKSPRANKFDKFLLCPKILNCYANGIQPEFKLDESFWVRSEDQNIEITKYCRILLPGNIDVSCYLCSNMCGGFKAVLGQRFFQEFRNHIQIFGPFLVLGNVTFPLMGY